MEIAAEFYSVAAFFPGISVTDFIHRVPRVHGRCGKGISDPGIALRGKPRRAPCVLAAETHSLNPEFTDEVIHGIVLRSTIHRQSGHRDRYRIHFVRGKNMIPGNHPLLRTVVEVGAESGKILSNGSHPAARGKSILLTNRVTAEERVTIGKVVIDANDSLTLKVAFIADIEIIVAIVA